jgi:ParB/RepB/Spo0J family partition protein
MSETATLAAPPVEDDAYKVVSISMKDLWHDESFNCRGPISPLDVADLAKSIDEHGLQFPITVQPRADVTVPMPEGKQWRIIAGHRRHKAVSVLGKPTIPCMIRKGLTEAQARILNLSENFDRKDLDIVQEAHALAALEKAGVARDTVAKAIGKSSSWVQVRYYILRLPEEIQHEARAGILNQYQIKQLYSLETVEQQFDAVRKIKEAKQKGEKPADIAVRKKQSTSVKKERKRNEIFDMMELIAKTVGYGFTTRSLAWASGEICTAELFTDLKVEAEKNGKTFIPPMEF